MTDELRLVKATAICIGLADKCDRLEHQRDHYKNELMTLENGFVYGGNK